MFSAILHDFKFSFNLPTNPYIDVSAKEDQDILYKEQLVQFYIFSRYNS